RFSVLNDVEFILLVVSATVGPLFHQGPVSGGGASSPICAGRLLRWPQINRRRSIDDRRRIVNQRLLRLIDRLELLAVCAGVRPLFQQRSIGGAAARHIQYQTAMTIDELVVTAADADRLPLIVLSRS